MENFYYARIYDVLCDNRTHEEKVTELNCYKTKIVQLHSDRVKRVLLETDEAEKLRWEFNVLPRSSNAVTEDSTLYPADTGRT